MSRLIASSSTFQGLCGVDNANEARQHCHFETDDGQKGSGVDLDDYTTEYPIALIDWLDADGFTFNRITRQDWSLSGTISFSIILELPPDLTRNDEHVWFMNQMSSILDEMMDNAGLGESVSGESHLNVTQIEQVQYYMPEIGEVEILDPEKFSQRRTAWMVLQANYEG